MRGQHVFRHAHQTHRAQVAEEVLNDTLLVIWDRPESFSGRSKLSTWIFGIAYRKALKALRRQDQPLEDEQLESRPGFEIPADEQMERSEISQMLSKAISELSPDHRAVVDLCYFSELGYREIAEIVDCPVDTVKTRMFHARRHLKGRLTILAVAHQDLLIQAADDQLGGVDHSAAGHAGIGFLAVGEGRIGEFVGPTDVIPVVDMQRQRDHIRITDKLCEEVISRRAGCASLGREQFHHDSGPRRRLRLGHARGGKA